MDGIGKSLRSVLVVRKNTIASWNLLLIIPAWVTLTVIAVGTYKSPTAYADAWATFVSAAQASTNDESGVDIPTRPIPPVAQEYTTTINSSGAVQNWLFNITITAKGGGQVVDRKSGSAGMPRPISYCFW